MGTSTSQDLIVLLIYYVALFCSIGFHEFSHVLSAYLQGDRTGQALGRLTLNPLKHLDPVGTIAMVLWKIGWGKPAPFNPSNLRYRRWGSALVAIAGPISNIVLIMVSGYILLLVNPLLPSNNLLKILLESFVSVNALLAVFNLLPIFPLDGSHILSAALGEQHPINVFLERYGFFILIGLLLLSFLGVGILSAYIYGVGGFLLKILGLGSLGI